MSNLKKTSKSVIKALYQLTYDFDRILESVELEYWMDGGTYLGAIRHNGIIPWDDDVDVAMEYKNRNKLLLLKSQFKKCGYTIIKTWFGYKVCYINKKLVEGEKYSFPNLDVFLYKKTKGVYIPAFKQVRETWPNAYYNERDVYPLKQYQFGDITIPGIANHQEYFDRMYGKDWNTVAYRQYDHQKEEEVTSVKVKLTKKDRVPAEPTKVTKRRCAN